MKVLIKVAILLLAMNATANAAVSVYSATQKTAEHQVRRLIEPVIEKYCREQCKLMSVQVSVDIATQEEVSPGFEDFDMPKNQDLAPSAAQVKILVDDQVGPVSRSKLVELIQQYLDTLDYPVKIDTIVAHFPQPLGSSGKFAELREKVSKEFKTAIEGLFQKFCPDQCLLTDFNLNAAAVNSEEAQYGAYGEYLQDGDTALKIKELSATILLDENMTPEDRNNISEMAKLKTSGFKNVNINTKAIKFPKPDFYYAEDGTLVRTGGKRGLASEKNEKSSLTSDSKFKSDNQNTTSNNNKSMSTHDQRSINQENRNETNQRQENYTRIEKIERVENGDAVQAELKTFKIFGIIFAAAVFILLTLIFVMTLKPKSGSMSHVYKMLNGIENSPGDFPLTGAMNTPEGESPQERHSNINKRYEIERLTGELSSIFVHHPKVAKHVFSRILTEEGVETTAQYINIFGETIVMDMLRDASLQSDMTELMEFYAKNPFDLTDDEKLDLLKKLHNRTVAGKLAVMGNRSSNLFDFLTDMDGMQILELIRTENLTVKSIALTQCDPQKRSIIFANLDDDIRMKILGELSRIDYLPSDYIFNVANALKRKRKENPRLNTEALPGSEVLVSLLERTSTDVQKTVVKTLENTNPDNARNVKGKLVSIETLRFLRDGQLLEVVLSLRHDELIQFLKGASKDIRETVFSRSPKELVIELEEELEQAKLISRETYQNVERKILNRMKVMANEGLINLIETNERMFANGNEPAGLSVVPQQMTGATNGTAEQHEGTRKIGGW
jgi:flagellar motor switch protein FliG